LRYLNEYNEETMYVEAVLLIRSITRRLELGLQGDERRIHYENFKERCVDMV
jgi:hypothetical protein